MKTGAGINEAEQRKSIWFFKKNSKTDKLLAIWTKEKRKKTQNAKIWSESGTITISITETKWIINKLYEQLFVTKWDKLDKMGKSSKDTIT